MLKIKDDEDYNSSNYWYKHLLKNVMNLEREITLYLMEDIYSRKDTCEENVIDEVQTINDITNFILEREKEKQGEKYCNYREGDCEKRYQYKKNIHFSWYNLELIKDEIYGNIQTYIADFSLKINKGFDTGIGLTNYATIDVSLKRRKDNCIYYEYMIGVSTTNGDNFRVYVSDSFVKKVEPELDREALIYNKRLEYGKTFETTNDAVKYVMELIDKLVEKVD